jgi:ankyrin repeat protein
LIGQFTVSVVTQAADTESSVTEIYGELEEPKCRVRLDGTPSTPTILLPPFCAPKHLIDSIKAADQVFGRTALHYAVVMDNLACLKHLEDNGGNKMVGVDGGKGEPLIITAYRYGCNNVARWLLETAALVNYKFEKDFTPLHCAAEFGSREIALFLLKKGAAVNCKDYQLRTPLHEAESRGHVAVLGLLTAWNADINAECSLGFTSLHVAAMNNQALCIQLVALAGGDIMQPINQVHGNCVCHIAVLCGHENVVRWLREKDVQVDLRNTVDFTGLMFASQFGRYDIAKLLIDKGANVNSKLYIEDNETPLHFFMYMRNNNVGTACYRKWSRCQCSYAVILPTGFALRVYT